MKRLLTFVFILSCAVRASDDDKDRLFNTFYFEGDTPSYVLTLHADRGFDLYDERNHVHVSGKFRADEEYITLTSGDIKRMFKYDMKGHDLRLDLRDGDRRTEGSVLGDMPPRHKGRVVFLTESNWKRMGRPLLSLANVRESTPPTAVGPVSPPPVAPVQPPPVAIAPPPPVAVAPAVVAVPVRSLKDAAGTYVYRPNPFITETLALSEDGTFKYNDSNGANASGSAKFENGVLVLTSDEVVRRLSAAMSGTALLLTRADSDAPKLRNDLATMSPTAQKSAKYETKK